MAERRKIKTPWKQQWRRIRYQLIPVVTMLTCSIAVGILWHRQYGGTETLGHFEEVKAAAMARQNGTLVPLGRKAWSLYDLVLEDQVIARLDDRQAWGQVAGVLGEVERLRAELTAREANVRVEDTALAKGAGKRHAAVELEDARLEMLGGTAMALQDTIEMQRHEGVLAEAMRVLKAVDQAGAGEALATRDAAQGQMNRLTDRRYGHVRLAETARARMMAAAQAMARSSEAMPEEVDAIVGPVRLAAGLQEAALRKIEVEVEGLEIRAPLTGKIVKIGRRAGQVVQAGDEVMTIAREQSDCVITYVRGDLRVMPSRDMTVYISPRLAGSKPVAARVESVGPQVEEIPEDVARNQKLKEWGVPVMIRLPVAYRALPGEVVNVRFPRGEEGVK